MIVSTVRIIVTGDTHEEILVKAEASLAEFLGVDPESIPSSISYELDIEENFEMDSDHQYKATMIAKIR